MKAQDIGGSGVRPRVSVVISTYKRAGLVSRAVSSALGQTIRDLEVIVVDDYSPDETGNVIAEICDARVRYLRHEKNKGLPAARNTGIAVARAEFVAFLDDDDEWVPEKIERQLNVVGRFDAVLCGALINGRRVKIHPRSEVTVDDLRGGNEFDPSSLLIRTAVVRELGFDEGLRQGEDWDVFIRIAQRQSIVYIAEPLLLYNDGGHARMTNEARNLSIPDIEKSIAVVHKHRDFFGPYWFRYHVADTYLAYIASRRGKLRMIRAAIARCGVQVVVAVLWRKISGRIAARLRAPRKIQPPYSRV